MIDAKSIDPEAARTALSTNDSYEVLNEAGVYLVTGETGTNVNDLCAIVIGSDTCHE